MTPLSVRRVWPLLPVVALLVGGCAGLPKTHEVKVDAIAKPAADAQSYRLKSKDPRLGEENLRYHEAADFVRTALSGKGMYEAPNDAKADVIVEMEYGLDAPRTKMERVSVPVYAQVGGGVRYDTVPVADSRGNVSTRTVAVYDPPRNELIGYEEMPRAVTIYEKYLRLTARENKPASEGRPPSELWSVQVSAEDESKDIRKYLPIMASASIDYIGKDSTNQQVVRVRENSPGVEFIKQRGMGDGNSTTLAVQAKVAPKI
jgi:hypothetical protein